MHTATAHKLTAALTGLFALAGTALAEDKPVRFDPSITDTGRPGQTALQDAQEKAGSCHLMANFDAYEDYIAAAIHPRLVAEIPQLLAPHQRDDGTPFHMGEAVDHGDLFHAHIMLPYVTPQTGPGLDPAFTDTEQYYLQYHTLEYSNEYRAKWRAELAALNEPAIDAWLQRLDAAQAARIARIIDFNKTQKEDPALIAAEQAARASAALSNPQRAAFAALWHARGDTGLAAWQLHKRLINLDTETPALPNDIEDYRSIASTDAALTIIQPLHIGTHYGPVQINFDERDANPALAAVIARAESLGLDTLYNPKARNLPAAHVDAPVDRALNDELFAAFTAATVPGETMHSVLTGISGSSNYTIRWNDEYIFSHGYFDMDRCPAAPRSPALQ
jgi:hypothetical protein